eukprot:7632308-Karenia_brevis.AAC.1
MQKQIETTSFADRKVRWTAAGNSVCRHGLFFLHDGAQRCSCLQPDALPTYEGRRDIKFMPKLSGELKCLVTVPFAAE